MVCNNRYEGCALQKDCCSQRQSNLQFDTTNKYEYKYKNYGFLNDTVSTPEYVETTWDEELCSLCSTCRKEAFKAVQRRSHTTTKELKGREIIKDSSNLNQEEDIGRPKLFELRTMLFADRTFSNKKTAH
jgi:hypothetical protein